jgi:aminoglycoside 6-adenylyltransferase
LRNEIEMLKMILEFARNDNRIRAVIMNGSRANPNVPKDCFQDYDIQYIVKDFQSFIGNHDWIDMFGNRLILEMPEAKELPAATNAGNFNYQMLFDDGNRIDLNLIPIERIDELFVKDSQTIVLLDKDQILPDFDQANNSDYYIKPPTKKLYLDCCNSFLWILQNIAKGIWRDELPYVMRMNEFGRDMLDQMVCWYIGIAYGYKISAGKFGKYFKKYLSNEKWEMYLKTYSDGDYSNVWGSLFVMCDLFKSLALEVAKHFNFEYPVKDDQNIMEYLKHVKVLPKGVNDIY